MSSGWAGKVLVVDDESRIRKLVRVNLEARGYGVLLAENGEEAINAMSKYFPDLVILDLSMPGIDGIEVCRWIRQRSDVPVLVLSAHDEENLKVRALDSGADDYLTKPFGQEELLARIRALMRRASGDRTSVEDLRIEFGQLVVDLGKKRALVNSQDIHLTRTEFALLEQLATNPDIVVTHQQLLARVWGPEYRGENQYLHVYFGQIRKKLGPEYAVLLETVSGVGYILNTSP